MHYDGVHGFGVTGIWSCSRLRDKMGMQSMYLEKSTKVLIVDYISSMREQIFWSFSQGFS